MNKDKKPNPTPAFPQRGQKQTALFELQDFLEKEIEEASPGTFYKSFTPISEGLGLESPKKSAPPVEMPSYVPPTRPIGGTMSAQKRMDINLLFDEPVFMDELETETTGTFALPATGTPTSGIPVSAILESMATKALGHQPTFKSVVAEPKKEAPAEVETEDLAPPKRATALPPKLPTVSLLRRLLATVADQIFVFTMWAIAVVITSNAFNGFQSGINFNIIGDFANPAFLRFSVMEFAALWLAYYAISLGILDLTFGMWVWGLRVSYGSPNDSQYWMRRMMRVIWSFFFFAPVIPAIILAFRRKGRNLLDVLSGTNLYVAG